MTTLGVGLAWKRVACRQPERAGDQTILVDCGIGRKETGSFPDIFAIGDDSVFLDPETKTMIAEGNPKRLLEESPDPRVQDFLTRGGKDAAGHAQTTDR